MAIIIINLILGIGISAYFGFTSFHGGFFNPLIAADGSMVKNFSFNFGSPMLWIIVFNLVAIIALVLLEKKLSDKSKKNIIRFSFYLDNGNFINMSRNVFI